MNTTFSSLVCVSLLLGICCAHADDLPPLSSAPLPPTLNDNDNSADGAVPPPDSAPPAPPPSAAEAPPPPTENSNEDQVTIVDRSQARYVEYRSHGHLYKIKVIPKVGPTYYLIDDQGTGLWHRYDGIDNNFKTPSWVIFRF
ncbi:MAG: DUF2782 domain-containing protein [Betaproteobacteria bacterium]|nr:DUF2782 domain-containing protein [Betaproteobacteria bacterium]